MTRHLNLNIKHTLSRHIFYIIVIVNNNTCKYLNFFLNINFTFADFRLNVIDINAATLQKEV